MSTTKKRPLEEGEGSIQKKPHQAHQSERQEKASNPDPTYVYLVTEEMFSPHRETSLETQETYAALQDANRRALILQDRPDVYAELEWETG